MCCWLKPGSGAIDCRATLAHLRICYSKNCYSKNCFFEIHLPIPKSDAAAGACALDDVDEAALTPERVRSLYPLPPASRLISIGSGGGRKVVFYGRRGGTAERGRLHGTRPSSRSTKLVHEGKRGQRKKMTSKKKLRRSKRHKKHLPVGLGRVGHG